MIILIKIDIAMRDLFKILAKDILSEDFDAVEGAVYVCVAFLAMLIMWVLTGLLEGVTA